MAQQTEETPQHPDKERQEKDFEQEQKQGQEQESEKEQASEPEINGDNELEDEDNSSDDMEQVSTADADQAEQVEVEEEGEEEEEIEQNPTEQDEAIDVDVDVDADADAVKDSDHVNPVNSDSESESESESGVDIETEAETKPKTKTKRKKKKAGKEVEPDKQVTILHMVFDQAGGEQIKQSFELAPEIAGEILYIEDNYSLGPVAELDHPHGWLMRKVWWQAVLDLSEEEQPEVMAADKMKLHQLFERLEEEEDTVLWIWMGQNERDVAGYYHVISQLMAFQGRIQVLYLNNLPFIDEKGHIFYPRQLAEILPREFVKASRLARIVTLSEFELDPEQWETLTKTAGQVRLLEGGKKLIVKEDAYYDGLILDQLGAQTMKLQKLLTLLSTKGKLDLPEYYIIWRIKTLTQNNQIISQGDFDKGLKNVSLKATRGELFVELNTEEDEVSENE